MQSWSSDVLPFSFTSIEHADHWLDEEARRAFSYSFPQTGSAALRYFKAVTEIIFWQKYVSGSLHTSTSLLTSRAVIGSLPWPEILSAVRNNPELASLFLALAHVASENVTPSIEADICRLVRTVTRFKAERSIFRVMDVKHSLSKLGVAEDDSALLQTFSCIPTRYDLLRYVPAELYALTHSIFYLSDFGRKTLTLDKKAVDTIRYSLDRAITQGDADIGAELILSLMFLNEIDECDLEIFSALARTQNQDGSWSPIDAVKDTIKNEGIPEQLLTFYANYHTTLLVRDVLARAVDRKTGDTAFLPSSPVFRILVTNDGRRDCAGSGGDAKQVNVFEDSIAKLLMSPKHILSTCEMLAICRNERDFGIRTNDILATLAQADSLAATARGLRIQWAARVATGITPHPYNYQEPGELAEDGADALMWRYWRGVASGRRTNEPDRFKKLLLDSLFRDDVLSFSIFVCLFQLDEWLTDYCEEYYCSMQSDELGYGFPNPRSPFFQEEKVLLALMSDQVSRALRKYNESPFN